MVGTHSEYIQAKAGGSCTSGHPELNREILIKNARETAKWLRALSPSLMTEFHLQHPHGGGNN